VRPIFTRLRKHLFGNHVLQLLPQSECPFGLRGRPQVHHYLCGSHDLQALVDHRANPLTSNSESNPQIRQPTQLGTAVLRRMTSALWPSSHGAALLSAWHRVRRYRPFPAVSSKTLPVEADTSYVPANLFPLRLICANRLAKPNAPRVFVHSMMVTCRNLGERIGSYRLFLSRALGLSLSNPAYFVTTTYVDRTNRPSILAVLLLLPLMLVSLGVVLHPSLRSVLHLVPDSDNPSVFSPHVDDGPAQRH